jgi:hypothetical protein
MASFLQRLSSLKVNNRVAVALCGDIERLQVLPEIAKSSMCPGVYVDKYDYPDGTMVICNIWDADNQRARMFFSNIIYQLIYLYRDDTDLVKYLANRIHGATVIVICAFTPGDDVTTVCKTAEVKLLVLKDRLRPFLSDLIKLEYDNRLQKETERLMEECS